MSDRRRPVVLAVETAGSACSVAVGRGEAVLAHERREMRHGHAEALLPMIDRVMQAAGREPAEIGVVAASVGPGGFTGIRAGLAAAQGVALAAQAQLVGITSFEAVMALLASDETPVLVALDSRREDLYVEIFDARGNCRAPPAAVLPGALSDFVQEIVGDARLRIAGDAAGSAIAALAGRNGIAMVAASAPDARGVLAAAKARGAAVTRPVRALYLRPPDVTLPKPRPGFGSGSSPRITSIPENAAEPLAALHRLCFPDDPWEAGALSRVMALSGGFGWLAWAGTMPVGFILVRDLGSECEVLSLGVAPRWRRRGIAQALLAAAIAEAERRELASLVLEVAVDNQAASALYSSTGFIPVGRRARYYHRPGGRVDALILRLTLSPGQPSARRC